MEGKESNVLFAVPVEVRAKIFEKLDSKSLLQMRLSCCDCKTLIDNYVGVDAFLSEICMTPANVQRQFDFFSKVALRNVYIGIMNGTPQSLSSRRRLKWSWWLKHHTFTDLFRYPEYIQSVTCNCEISFWLLQEIMTNCFNMRSLEFNPISKIHGILSFVQPSESTDLESSNGQGLTKRLYYKKLERLLLSNIDLNEKRQACINSITILKSIRSSALKQFKFECWPSESLEIFNELIETLKDFITFHYKLKEMHLIFRLTTVMQNVITLEESTKLFTKYLTEIANHSRVETFGLDVYSKSNWIWKPLLKHQQHLKTVQFTTLLSATAWNFQDLFSGSCFTLTTLSLQIYVPLQYGSYQPIDLSGLEMYVNLKEVSIINKSTNLRCVHNFNPLLTNLDCLPAGLKTLAITYIVLETEEIKSLLRKLDKIKNLMIVNSVLTRFSAFGVSTECLQEILNKNTLESVLITGLNMAYKSIALISEDMVDSQDEKNNIVFDLEIVSDDCPFIWSKVRLDSPTSLGHFYTLSRKFPYMGACQ